jgi:hypothetical protein
MKRLCFLSILFFVGLLIVSCATIVKPNIKFLSAEKFSPKPENCSLEIIEAPVDSEKMIPIAELQVFAEQEPVMGHFKKQTKEQYILSASKIACRQGADGITNIFYQQFSINGISFKYKE